MTVVVESPRSGTKVLRLSRPAQLNAMTVDLVAALHIELDKLATDNNTSVVILTGEGRGFCAGLDLHGYGTTPGNEDRGPIQSTMATQVHISSLVQKIRRLPQVFIAAVNGAAAGGGFALVCACDIRIAAQSAVFAVSFIRVGFSGCDIGTSWMLPRIVGAGRAHELMLTGRRFDAAEALHMGLLADVVPDAELMTRVDAAVDALVAAPPMSLALTKRGMWMAMEIAAFDTAVEMENRQQVLTSATADQHEAMDAFVAKRRPEYTHR